MNKYREQIAKNSIDRQTEILTRTILMSVRDGVFASVKEAGEYAYEKMSQFETMYSELPETEWKELY